MSMHDRLVITISGHDTYEVTANHMDRTIAKHLPDSPYGLRLRIDTHPGNRFEPGHFDNLITVTELLMVLAYLDGTQLY